MKSSITINSSNIISAIDNRIYSSFIEHMGRAVYTGIYEKDHPAADKEGFRTDVEHCIKELSISHIRYPGGNFLSGYRWEDGIGDRSTRPVRRDLAWAALEPNWIGINEFVMYCKRNNIEPMIGVNLGTRGPQDAANLLEYCNVEKGTYYSDLRRSHGYENPHNIKLWCLGNEMDGPWQICSKTAEEYGRIAYETAKMMKRMDPDIELVACGSSFKEIPTFGEWEKTVLRHCWEHIDYLSLHQYYHNRDGNIENFLSKNNDMDAFIKEVSALCTEEKKRRNSTHDVKLSFDEWNVWYHFSQTGVIPEKWICPRPIEEEDYDFADALLVGSMLITLLNNSDSVKIACLAQLVNVIAPIMTIPGGDCWKQTIFYPFKLSSLNGRGTALKPEIACNSYTVPNGSSIPVLDCAAVLSQDKTKIVFFIVNKDLENTQHCEINLGDFSAEKVLYHTELKAPLEAKNTLDSQQVVPVTRSFEAETKSCFTADFKPASWNMICIDLL